MHVSSLIHRLPSSRSNLPSALMQTRLTRPIMSIRQTLLAGLALASSVIAKAPETPTPSDGPKFNVTAALEAYGVYVEDIPALDETNRRSNAAGCQAAVSHDDPTSRTRLLTPVSAALCSPSSATAQSASQTRLSTATFLTHSGRLSNRRSLHHASSSRLKRRTSPSWSCSPA